MALHSGRFGWVGRDQASASCRTVGGRATPAARRREACSGAWRRAQQKAFAVLVRPPFRSDEFEIGEDVRPGTRMAERGDAVLQLPSSAPGRESYTTHGRAWSRRAYGKSGAWRTGFSRFGTRAPPSTNVCSKAWFRRREIGVGAQHVDSVERRLRLAADLAIDVTPAAQSMLHLCVAGADLERTRSRAAACARRALASGRGDGVLARLKRVSGSSCAVELDAGAISRATLIALAGGVEPCTSSRCRTRPATTCPCYTRRSRGLLTVTSTSLKHVLDKCLRPQVC